MIIERLPLHFRSVVMRAMTNREPNIIPVTILMAKSHAGFEALD